MLEIFIAAIAGFIIGIVLIKYWYLVAIIFSLLQDGMEFICSLPLNLTSTCISANKLQTKITREYDRMFFRVKNIKRCRKHRRKIIKLQRALLEQKMKKHIRETKKFLNKAKWLI